MTLPVSLLISHAALTASTTAKSSPSELASASRGSSRKPKTATPSAKDSDHVASPRCAMQNCITTANTANTVKIAALIHAHNRAVQGHAPSWARAHNRDLDAFVSAVKHNVVLRAAGRVPPC